GCYVRYDHEALVGIVALEAQRAGAFIVGEDLGTVEPWVRHYLAHRGILGTTVLWFECDDTGQALPPDQWRASCMASVTTHDLPPTAGFLALDHVKLRHDLGLLTEPLDVEMAAARTEQQFWLDYLDEHGYIHTDSDGVAIDPEEATVLGLHKALTDSPSQVRSVALVDAVGDRRTQNQPGTIDEYPNWRIPLSDASGHAITLEDVFASRRAMRMAAVMNDWSHVPAPVGQREEV
ncbi:MAG: 4-alpha-glucanotransferase, partial [Propionibacteriaceae bacterium]|nr:4-alpha-glucanotransferase [Propionibacteriaceae bacterium]